MTETAEPIEDRLADFTRDKRILLLSLMAVVVGAMSAFVAKALVWLIAVFTNLTFYQRFSSEFLSPTNHRLDGALRFRENPRPRHSRGARSDSLRAQPNGRESSSFETALFRDLDRL